MLHNHDPLKPIYVLGHSVQAEEIAHMIGSQAELVHHDNITTLPSNAQCIIGFSNIGFRKKLLSQDFTKSWSWPTFVHPNAIVESSAMIGHGCVIYPMTTILHKARLGDFGLVFPHSHVSHGCQLGKNVVLCPFTVIGGSTNVGDNVFFGQSSSVKDKITIGDDLYFFMSSVVNKNVTEPGTYYGHKRSQAR